MRPVPAVPGGSGGGVGSSGGVSGALTNVALLAGLLGAAAAQAAKVFTGSRAPGGGFDWSLALSAGGMPSSHTALVVALAMAIGVEVCCGVLSWCVVWRVGAVVWLMLLLMSSWHTHTRLDFCISCWTIPHQHTPPHPIPPAKTKKDGTGSSVFALAVVMAAIVAYDASGVRLHAGRAAAAVNQLLSELPDGHSLAGAPLLRDRLGHEPEEVAAGAAVGAVAGLLVAFLFGGGGGGGGGGSGSGPAALSPSPGPLL
jgi:acid phosphatase family membrane protein YuiD